MFYIIHTHTHTHTHTHICIYRDTLEAGMFLSLSWQSEMFYKSIGEDEERETPMSLASEGSRDHGHNCLQKPDYLGSTIDLGMFIYYTY